jgi:hypothetical protein
MRKTLSPLFLGFIIVAGMVVLFMVTTNPSAAQNVVSQTEITPTPSIVHGAAISLHASNDPALTIPGARFTSTDAAQWVGSHAIPHTLISTKPVVSTVVFITSQEASTRLHGESIGIPYSSLVCYVTFHGSFTVPGPANSKVATFSNGAEIFDAQTGNLLLVSFLS